MNLRKTTEGHDWLQPGDIDYNHYLTRVLEGFEKDDREAVSNAVAEMKFDMKRLAFVDKVVSTLGILHCDPTNIETGDNDIVFTDGDTGIRWKITLEEFTK